MPYVSVGLTSEARDLLRAVALELTSPAGRRLTMSEVLIALAELGERHRDELLDILRA